MQRTSYFYLLILAAILLVSCGSRNSISLDLEEATDEVRLFGEGVLSTPLYERDIAITPSGDEIIFTLGDQKQRRRMLVALSRKKGRWSAPEILNISGKYQDIEPFLAEEGNRLFFASDRPLHSTSSRTDYNIWYSDRMGDQWGEPIALPANINTEENEFYPSVSRNGNLYFTATRLDGVGREDLFRSEWKEEKYQDPEPLDTAINTIFYEFNAYINPDENLLIFSSFGRPNDIGGGDLYYSKKDPFGNWIPAQPLSEKVNSKQLDYCPFIDENRAILYFTSDRSNPAPDTLQTVKQMVEWANQIENGFGNLYRIRMNALDLE